MRIISGSLKGRKLHRFRGDDIRPTTDRLREALFNILGDRFGDRSVLDLFAGSGAMGLEALSRGAAGAVFVDNHARALDLIRKNVAGCGMEKRSRTIRWDIRRNLDCLKPMRARFHVAFVDPPYRRNLVAPAMRHLAGSRALADGALLVVEHADTEDPPAEDAHFSLCDRRRYGKTVVSILRYVV